MVKHTVSLGLRNGMNIVGGVASLISISAKLTGVMFMIVPALVGVGTLYGGYLRKLSKLMREEKAIATASAQESIANIRTVRAFANEELEVSKYSAQIEHVHQQAARLGSLIGTFHICTSLSANGIALLTLFIGQKLAESGDINGGSGGLGSFMMHALRLQGSLGQISVLSGEISKGRGACDRILDVLNAEPDIPIRGGSSPEAVGAGHILIKEVTFAYPGRQDVPVFQNFSLELQGNSVTALVGPSGAGKSTVAALLERFYEPQHGTIYLDGENIKGLDPSWLRSSCIGIVSQEPVLFAGSIRDNILYGKPGATDEEVFAAAEVIHILDVTSPSGKTASVSFLFCGGTGCLRLYSQICMTSACACCAQMRFIYN